MVLHSHLVLILYLLILMQIRLGIQLNCRFITGIVDFFDNCPITWSAKKQAIVFRSSTKVEYRTLASSTAELCWICMLLRDLGIFLPHPPLLWCDNVSALAIASNPVFHACTKHIKVDYHFVKERVLKHDLHVKFISFHDQLADIFTKGLPSPRFHWLTSKLMWKFPFRLRGDESPTCRIEELVEEEDTIPTVTPKTVLSKNKASHVSHLDKTILFLLNRTMSFHATCIGLVKCLYVCMCERWLKSVSVILGSVR